MRTRTGTERHRWRFFRTGGVDQVDLRTGEDIIHLDQLDQKLWAALACPVDTLEFDRRTLELLDLDKDQRIRAPEIVAATRWVKEVFKNPDDIVRGGDTLELSSINETNALGAGLLDTARKVLQSLGKEDATVLSLADVSDSEKIFAATHFNGDGIIPATSTEDAETRRAIEEIIATQGGTTDRSGKLGIDQAMLDQFMGEIAALLAWQSQADSNPALLPLGSKTAEAAAATAVVERKIDDYFIRCRLAEFDERYREVVNAADSGFASAAANELLRDAEAIARLPLARIEPARPLPLVAQVNPAWASALQAFRAAAVQPLLGPKDELLETEWQKLRTALSPFNGWMKTKPATAVENLGTERLREISSSGVAEKITALIQKDQAFGVAAEQINALEKMVRVKRDFMRLLNNFVSFADFYARRGAIFQAGTLYLDSRSCDLCVHVADSAKHAALAGMARAYLVYADCARQGVKRSIAAAVTAGDSDHLMVGRNGVFYDRSGNDWDATITKIIESPISIRQAFLNPYKKFIRMVEEQIAKRAAAAEAASEARLGQTATHIAELKPADASKAPQRKVDVGTVAALGVALGSIGTFAALIFSKFIDLGWWAPLAVVGIVIAISGPSMLIAYLKLRQRNLGPILDANGWAVNGRMQINVPFGGALSNRARLPRGATRSVHDPFGDRRTGRNTIIFILILLVVLPICWRLHLFDRFLPENLRPAPASTAAPAAENTGAATSLDTSP